jgi:hypothetical protein
MIIYILTIKKIIYNVNVLHLMRGVLLKYFFALLLQKKIN